MIKEKLLTKILRSPQTVFSFKELTYFDKDLDLENLRSKVSYYVKSGYLIRLRRGIYAKDKNYNKFELATRIFIPSYISFETVLFKSGVIFQYYSQIFLASYQSREIECDDQLFIFRSLRDSSLTNPLGVSLGYYSIATPERAFLDTLYINKDYYFDNLNALNWDKVWEFSEIYNDSPRFREKLNEQYKILNQ